MRESGRPWPRATHLLLQGTGVLLAALTFFTVLGMPELPYHPARDLELRATYDTYRETGVPLVKVNGTGSWYGAVEGAGLTKAAGDDDPGSYLIASWMSHLTGSDSPYTGLGWVMALLCALPMLILPVTMARVFQRARAGLAMLALPAVTWLVNGGTVLVGTEYGLSDQVSPVRVYALYGLPAALLFASLVLLAYSLMRRPSLPYVVLLTVVFVVLATSGNLLRSMSGVGTALAVGVLWWVTVKGRARWVVAPAVSVVCALASLWLPGVVMDRIDAQRAEVISPETARLPSAHTLWHPLYLGLSYPQPLTGEASPFGVTWSDEAGWAAARAVDPDVVVASAEYDAIMKDLYLDRVAPAKWQAARLYLGKALYTVKHFGATILLILMAALLVWRRRGPHRAALAQLTVASLPGLCLGLLPVVLVMPMLYYYTELVAVLGFLTAVAVAGLAWVLSTLPSLVRVEERALLQLRSAPVPLPVPAGVSVVVPTRNGAPVVGGTLEKLAQALGEADELIVVENGSSDDTTEVLERVHADWQQRVPLTVLHSEPGLGNALRTGVLASRGDRVLLTADDLPFGFSDLDAFRRLDQDEVVVAVGSKAHPGSVTPRSWRRQAQSRVFRWLRTALLHSAVGDSQGTIWVDGPWARAFAAVSRETGLMWTVELVLAAEQQGLDVWEVPVVLEESHDSRASRFRLGDATTAVREISRLAVRKDDYLGQRWATTGTVLSMSTEAAAPE
ncbi:MAG TPA: glycosyltransferase [Nocardioides sp.]|nr:glycosyltransferase [Nocardioides sp.]